MKENSSSSYPCKQRLGSPSRRHSSPFKLLAVSFEKELADIVVYGRARRFHCLPDWILKEHGGSVRKAGELVGASNRCCDLRLNRFSRSDLSLQSPGTGLICDEKTKFNCSQRSRFRSRLQLERPEGPESCLSCFEIIEYRSL